MNNNRFFYFCFLFICFAYNCFAYDIEPYTKQAAYKSGESLNLVFCSLNYQDKGDFAKDREMVFRRLKQTKPFDERDSLKIWYINFSKKEEGVIFKPTSAFPPLKVRRDFLDNIRQQLKSNYKLVIIDAQGLVSCAELSLPDKMSLIILGKKRYADSASFTKGFLHELGHSLGLRDERMDSDSSCPPGPPNCAATKEEAVQWWGDLVGKDERVNYIAGCCGRKNYIRPTIASYMNNPDKAGDFGPVNERYLRKILTRDSDYFLLEKIVEK